jgi:hypothetical protein
MQRDKLRPYPSTPTPEGCSVPAFVARRKSGPKQAERHVPSRFEPVFLDLTEVVWLPGGTASVSYILTIMPAYLQRWKGRSR